MSAGFAEFDFAAGSPAQRTPAAPGSVWRVGLPLRLRGMPQTAAPRGLSIALREWCAALASCMVGPQEGAAPTAAGEPAALDGADVDAALRGDQQAYARLVRRYQAPIAAYMRRFTRDRRQWEELVHDVFVAAYLGLANYAGRAPLLHWLKRIGTRVGYRYWKDRRRHRREMALADTAGPLLAAADGSDSARHAAEVVHRLLAQLAPRDRLVLTLIYLESQSIAETARLTGWSETMVKVQSHRARKRLAKICTQEGIEL